MIGKNVYEAPWFPYSLVFFQFISIFGIYWDIARHFSIGREGLFIAPHFAVMAFPLAALFLSLIVIYQATFNYEDLRNNSIRIGRLWAPSGIWVMLSGVILYLVSFILDNWWHSAFGLDIQMYSMSHVMLHTGLDITMFGLFLVILQKINISSDNKTGLWILLLMAVSFMLCRSVVNGFDIYLPEAMHSSYFYNSYLWLFPILIAVSAICPLSFSATSMACLQLLFAVSQELILSSIPATPLYGPVYHKVTHMVTANDWVILAPAALVIDLWNKYFGVKRSFVYLLGVVTLSFITYVFVQWWVAKFVFNQPIDSFFGLHPPFFFHADAPFWKQYWLSDLDSKGNFSFWIFLSRLSLIWILGLIFSRIALKLAYFFVKIKK